MFDLIKEVPSLELCKKLKSLGLPQDTGGWYWVLSENGSEWLLCYYVRHDKSKDGIWNFWSYNLDRKPEYIHVWRSQERFIKAPTVRELGEWLPCYLPELKFLHIERNEDGFHYYYDEKTFDGAYVIANTEANARAKMLIWLAENGYVKFGEQK